MIPELGHYYYSGKVTTWFYRNKLIAVVVLARERSSQRQTEFYSDYKKVRIATFLVHSEKHRHDHAVIASSVDWHTILWFVVMRRSDREALPFTKES